MAATHSSQKDGQYYGFHVNQQYLEKPLVYTSAEDVMYRASYYHHPHLLGDYRGWAPVPAVYGRHFSPAHSASSSSSNIDQNQWGYNNEKRRRVAEDLPQAALEGHSHLNSEVDNYDHPSAVDPSSSNAHHEQFEGLGSFSDFTDTSFALFGDGSQPVNFLTTSELDSTWDLCLGGIPRQQPAAHDGSSPSSKQHPQSPYIHGFSPDEQHSGDVPKINDILADITTVIITDATSGQAAVSAVATGRPLEAAIDDEDSSKANSFDISTSNMDNNNYNTDSDANNGQRYNKRDYSAEDAQAQRPSLNDENLAELNDISSFRKNEKYRKLIVDYNEGISFPLGEGGRELLRACLNVKGCKGRQLQGASVPALLGLAKKWGVWDVAIRIKVERSTGQLCDFHERFVRFKANQSQQRKFVKKEYMVTERGFDGKISKIVYDENRKITLGKEGREALRAQLRRLHDKHPVKMDELLSLHGFKYSELRNATVQQLSRMAFVCNLWDQVVHACRKQEEKRDCKSYRTGFGDEDGQCGLSPSADNLQPGDDIIVATTQRGSMTSCGDDFRQPAVAETLTNALFAEEPQSSCKVDLKSDTIAIEDAIKYSHLWGGSEVLEQMLQKQSLNEFPKDEDSMFQSFLGTINALDSEYSSRNSTSNNRSTQSGKSPYDEHHCWYG